SGISQAISRSCRSAVRRAFQIAREAGVRTSYDPNFRPKLWSSNEAREALEEILPSTHIFLHSSPDETRQLLNTADAREIDGRARCPAGAAGAAVDWSVDRDAWRGFYHHDGIRSHSRASYAALGWARECALERRFRKSRLYRDSELLGPQIPGEYQVGDPG